MYRPTRDEAKILTPSSHPSYARTHDCTTGRPSVDASMGMKTGLGVPMPKPSYAQADSTFIAVVSRSRQGT